MRRPWKGKDMNMPAPEISFSADIKPLFREKDRDSMRRAFDLWSYADVQTHADAIAERLKNGPMRCDGGGPRNGSGCSNPGSSKASRRRGGKLYVWITTGAPLSGYCSSASSCTPSGPLSLAGRAW